MKSGFVNLNRVRQEAARKEAEARQTAAAAAPSTPPPAAPSAQTSSSQSLSPPTSQTHGSSPPQSPFRAPVVGTSLLVRRNHTVGSKPQRNLSATQRRRVEEEPEDDKDNADSVDADTASVTTEESTVDIVIGAGGLTRHGSLPSRTAPYPISPVRTGFASSSRPRFGTHRSSGGQTQYESIASVTDGAGDLHAYGAEDDEEWERALAERRRNGGATNDGDHDDPSGQVLSSSAPKGNSLHHQRSLPHYRSLNFNTATSSGGSRSPPLLSPHYYSSGLAASSSTSLLPGTSTQDGSSHTSTSGTLEESPYMTNPGVRRHQSLTQPGVHSRAADRLNRSPFTDPHSRNGSEDDLGGPSGWRRNDLPPPTSPIRGSPWDAPQQDLLARQRSWDAEQQQSTSGPLSPVPGSGSRWRRDESGSGGDGAAMTAEQLQNAFDAISLGRSMGPSTASLQPPPHRPQDGSSGASSPDPHGHHSRAASGSSHSFQPGPPADRTRHSRSPSLNPPAPRFSSPSPGPQAHEGGPVQSHPYGNDGGYPVRPGVSVPSFPHRGPQGSQNPSPSGTIKLSLMTDATTLAQGAGANRPYAGPQSAAAYVPPVGHSTQPPLSSGGYPGPGVGVGGFGGHLGGALGMGGSGGAYAGSSNQKPFTAMGTGWEQKNAILGARPTGGPSQFQGSTSTPMYPGQPGGPAFPRPSNFGGPLGGQQAFGLPPMQQSLGQQANYLAGGPAGVYGVDPSLAAGLLGGAPPVGGPAGIASGLSSPIDVPSLIQAKGYNPTVFDTSPPRARFFVIKSYTEDDVAKSLKFEIWSSTTFGNKRLDKAFKESAAVMPIYLFFSVNSSGHFAGVAQMLTEVDYNTTSTVWAQDKWKGVFRLRWIFIKDVPNQALRHIRLNNTQERKPVTNSRDTQELLPEAGIEMLKIFHAYQSRTSLLQDYAFYDLQSAQKELSTQIEAARQPVAHLPPFPAQPTYTNQQQPPGPAYASSVIYQQQQQQQQQGRY